jgi:2-dehydro-3-deoxy-D-arabinonate dehydratase
MAVGCVVGDNFQPLRTGAAAEEALTELLEAGDSPQWIDSHAPQSPPVALDEVTLLPPIDAQEVWAAGVTYKRSRTARMEESSNAASCYDRVYLAPRPELFFKATAHRVAGHSQPLRIRRDSQWNVPEPELALALNSRLELVGFTIGNDMSSRDIEGENPLYLPQAKVYNQCCGLGPWITLADAMPPRGEIGIHLSVHRGGEVVYQGSTGDEQMARSFEELIGWLGRDNSFPHGAFLLTGTGVVPGSDFSLTAGDRVDIMIDGIGTLSNPIVQESQP